MASTEIEEIGSFSISSSKFNWKIKNFSEFTTMYTYSDVFTAGSFKWRACIYPKGMGKVYDHLSLYLVPVDLTKSVNTEYCFAITSQTDRNNKVRKEQKQKFLEETTRGWGWTSFMPLSELHDPSKGYIVDDTCVISIEVTCWTMKEEDSSDDGVKESGDPHKVPEAKRSKTIENSQ
ncbi:hypothetical protein C5167_000306 [Papaver somniferum]|uniref:MATH domain-containing protein n=2 Tax=Papaver somniferum TaxID=3469 RepID=A0A4Y7KS26_PAPSO|nr:hypothetical protein C5167_000306 [Papaver somniferum]